MTTDVEEAQRTKTVKQTPQSIQIYVCFMLRVISIILCSCCCNFSSYFFLFFFHLLSFVGHIVSVIPLILCPMLALFSFFGIYLMMTWCHLAAYFDCFVKFVKTASSLTIDIVSLSFFISYLPCWISLYSLLFVSFLLSLFPFMFLCQTSCFFLAKIVKVVLINSVI